MTKYRVFDLEDGIAYTFTRPAVAFKWLKSKKVRLGNTEAFCAWLRQLFNGGDTVIVQGKDWTYEDCLFALENNDGKEE